MDDTQPDGTKTSAADESAVKKLTPAAQRALAEAAARREANATRAASEAKPGHVWIHFTLKGVEQLIGAYSLIGAMAGIV